MDPEPASNSNDDPSFVMDSAPALHDDPGSLVTDTDSASHDDFGNRNMDFESASRNISVSSDSSRCINCGLDITRMRRHTLESRNIYSVIQQWISPRQASSDSIICHSCWTLATSEIRNSSNVSNTVGHQHVCVSCGRSLLRLRSHALRVDTDRERRIRNVIAEWILPRQLRSTDCICHPCWQRSDRAAEHFSEASTSVQSNLHDASAVSQNTSEEQPDIPAQANQEGQIHLPNYARAPDTQSCCFFPNCTRAERLMVPTSLRVRLFCDYNYYVPSNCRICRYHLHSNSWHLLLDVLENPIQTFNANQIEDFASLLKDNMTTELDFEHIEVMPDHLVSYWLGFTKEQFRQILEDVPRLSNKHRGAFALAAYLLKLRTGDSDQRIASLLQTPRTTLERLMGMARELLHQDFVPENLGLRHISREEIAQRNLLIPRGLFGGTDNSPIVIADGTYVYVQKRSNYLYQKQTYSLHKYRNLIKPFLIVCSDGYIIDVLGPYPATTSDAQIVQNEFNSENDPMRRYFQPGDVFILDRGFRDSIPLLEECGYRVYVPSTLDQGETQLSTIEANKTRTVTICRWVVEVVNGIFKQQFKIFRQTFFNTASKHVMIDFSIAASLINKFHLRVTDRHDAAQILEIINENMYVNNDLADFVNERRLNRVRAHFKNISANRSTPHFPHLSYDDLILIACGTYQLKQARSYYGEHIRFNGTYSIEISRDRGNNLLEEMPNADNATLVRAKIQSRHISRKIYFVYVMINNKETGRNAIVSYCCNCIVGRRTVGCCSHVMTILWYLGWARHQSNIYAPATFLDHVLIVYDMDSHDDN